MTKKRSAGLIRKALTSVAPKQFESEAPEREELKTYLRPETANRMRNIVYWDRLVMWNFVDEAVAALCARHEKRNGPYDQRPEEKLRPGKRAR